MNRLFAVPFAIAVAMIVFGGSLTPASAQASRTWVSGVGDDVNPCSRTAPCKTFAGAISTLEHRWRTMMSKFRLETPVYLRQFDSTGKTRVARLEIQLFTVL